LILTARRLEKIEEIASNLRTQFQIDVLCRQMDVRDKQAVNDVISSLPTSFGNVDVLINNAGLVIGFDRVENVKSEDVQVMFDTNVVGVINVTQAVLPLMKKRNQGHIVMIGSVAGVEPYAGGGVYCATKHALHALTRSLMLELVDSPIRVSEIKPGMVETDFSITRFQGDAEKAKKVYQGMIPLNGKDIAELAVFIASRPDHVNIADTLIFPTAQAAATVVARK